MNEEERVGSPSLWWAGGMALDAPTMFDRLGGAAAIAEIVTKLYERTTTDPELGPYFHTTDIELQRRKLSEMIGEALGGPEAPWLLGLREAHRGRGVSHRHFSLLAAHLLDLLEELNVDPDETDGVMNWVAQGRDAVVEDLD
ncbi:MAG TPA: group 1 truncated hemoglobin [Ilumatobacteraceae bacterium]|nr:group 1 truncated hemoglobin [Ilumatobacteraceae bacterium]